MEKQDGHSLACGYSMSLKNTWPSYAVARGQ